MTEATKRKQPQDHKAKAKSNGQAEDFRVAFAVDGHSYSVGPGDLSAVEARLYRREMGSKLIAGLSDVDLDVIATLVWIINRRDDPTLTWEAVAETITYDSVEQIAEDDDPSA